MDDKEVLTSHDIAIVLLMHVQHDLYSALHDLDIGCRWNATDTIKSCIATLADMESAYRSVTLPDHAVTDR